MNFSKEFNQDFVKCGNADLPWEQVASDLSKWKKDKKYLVSILDNKNLKKDNRELYKTQAGYKKYGYNTYNTKIWKTTNCEPILQFAWEKEIYNQLPLDCSVATVTRQDPGQILPWHCDKFYWHRKKYSDDPREIWRLLIFLEDWKIGHHLFVGNSTLTHWKQGEVYAWKPGTMHLAGNSGIEVKWTCNITGFLKD